MIKTALRNSVAIDVYVKSYEDAHSARGNAEIRQHLPPRDHPLYQPVGLELLRIDLEFSWDQGTPNSLTHYQRHYPDLCGDADSFCQLAFEEYRLRLQAGEAASSRDYQRQYDIDVGHWPSSTEYQENAESSENAAGLDSLGCEADRLTSAIQAFPEVPSRFLDFDLVRELGRGSFGRVYLATQSGLANRQVALKVSAILPIEPDRMAQLQHTHIVPIYSLHRKQSLQAICMPYFGDRTLADAMSDVRRSHSLPRTGQIFAGTTGEAADRIAGQPESSRKDDPPRDCGRVQVHGSSVLVRNLSYVDACIGIVARVSDALAHAHQRGILHRDVKPANILLADDGRPMLMDFNLSDDAVAGGNCSIMVGGTLPYMAPEHIRSIQTGDSVTSAADIFSLGVLLFELLTRKRPYPDRHGVVPVVLRKMIADRQTSPPDVREFNPHVPRSMAAVVRRCLNRDPAQRYPSAYALADDLRRHELNLPLSHVPDRSVAERVRKWSRRHPRLSSLTSLSAVVATMLVVMLALWSARTQRLEYLEAVHGLRHLEAALPMIRVPLSGLEVDATSRQDGIAAARRLLATYGVPKPADAQDTMARPGLNAAQQTQLRRQLADLTYLVAAAELRGTKRIDVEGSHPAWQEALHLNEVARELYGEDVPRAVLQQQVGLLHQTGRHAEAKRVLDHLSQVSATRPMDQYLLAVDHYGRGEYGDALPLLQAARDADPTDVSYWFGLANAYVGVGRMREAASCFTTCIALYPNSHLGYFHRGLCRLEGERFDAACEDFDEVLRRKPRLPAAWLNRALAHQGAGRLQAARDDLLHAQAAGCTETRLFFLRSRIELALGNHDAARRLHDQGLRHQPSDEINWIARGIARLPNDPLAAMADFREALRYDPASLLALQNMAHILSDRIPDPEGAIQILDQMVELAPDDAAALTGRGVIHARLNQRTAALRDAEAALRVSRDADTLYRAGCIYALTSRSHPSDAAMAIALVGQTFRLDPNWIQLAGTDPDLEPIISHEDFRAVMSAAITIHQTTATIDQPRN